MYKYRFTYRVKQTGKVITVVVDDKTEAEGLRQMIFYCRDFYSDVSKIEVAL